MNLVVIRKWSELDRLRGELLIDGEHAAWTLEPPIRGEKPCAIPDGTYTLVNAFSPKHGHEVPHVESVPGFDEIEIHPGNTPSDTLGCLLVGTAFQRGSDGVVLLSSRAAFSALMQRLVPAWQAGEKVQITYQTALEGESNAGFSGAEGTTQ